MKDNQFVAFVVNKYSGYYAYSGVVPATGAQTEWYHVAGTFDGNRLKIYVNGEVNNEISASCLQSNGVADF